MHSPLIVQRLDGIKTLNVVGAVANFTSDMCGINGNITAVLIAVMYFPCGRWMAGNGLSMSGSNQDKLLAFPNAALNTIQTGWWELTLAKIFGKKCVGVDIDTTNGESTYVTTYRRKGKLYFAGVETRKHERV